MIRSNIALLATGALRPGPLARLASGNALAGPTLVHLAILAVVLLMPAVGWTQTGTSGSIAGVVRDTSGGVLPGVTVEAASPALIEKVRSVVSDGQGVYRIVDLRPGIYSVTFTLPGFSTLRREGIELTTGFTASVNAELRVGGLDETITISGAAPVVDTQNVIQRKVFSRGVVDALPVGKDVGIYATLIPAAVVPAIAQDVGGNRSENVQGFTIHGSRGTDFQQHRDGMFFGQMLAAGNLTKSANATAIQEVTVQTGGGGTPEYESGGAVINFVPKDGGNTFHGSFQGSFGHRNLQSDNLDDALRARGLTQGYLIRDLYDFGGGLGGPIRQDKLWFVAAFQRRIANNYVPGNYFNRLQGTWPPFYEADLSRPAWEKNFYNDTTVRLTWQAAQKHKITATYNPEYSCNCYFRVGAGAFSPEAAGDDFYWPNQNGQVAWSYPATNRLLFEAGATVVKALIVRRLTGGTYDDIGVTELARNYRYGSASDGFGLTTSWGDQDVGQTNQRVAVSYVTGSHNFKAGLQTRFGFTNKYSFINHNLSYRFRNRVPESVTFWAGPYYNKSRQWTIGLFAQDQWSIRRLTLNMGLRYDQLDGWIPALHLQAGPYVPERNFEKVPDVLGWKDLNPRLGAAYDLFGDDKTGLKLFLGRYVSFAGNFDTRLIGQSPASTMVASSTRTWNDANGDYIPQENELGPHSATDFGQVGLVTRYADDVTHGFGVREYSWQGSIVMQHELRPGLAVDVGYFRTWYGNFNVNDNLAVTPADFDPYCITAPVDSRLPGSGEQICGLYDIKPTAFGRIDNLVTQASNYGKQSEVFSGVDATVNARFGNGVVFTGGLSLGRTVTDRCFVVDSPQELRFCHVSQPWSAGTQLRFSSVYPLPWDFQASALWQNIPGVPTTASYVAGNALIAPSLGRNLGACGTRAVCTATAIVELIEPGTLYREGRFNQLNVRLTRVFRMRNVTVEPQFDVFNLFNANPVLGINTRYGPAWQNATAMLAPRLVKFGVLVNF